MNSNSYRVEKGEMGLGEGRSICDWLKMDGLGMWVTCGIVKGWVGGVKTEWGCVRTR